MTEKQIDTLVACLFAFATGLIVGPWWGLLGVVLVLAMSSGKKFF